MHVSDFDVLLAVINAGTYSSAATMLHLNDHSAVAKQIRRVERSLGVTLLTRDDYGRAVLTEVGDALLPHIVVLKSAYDAVVSCAASFERDSETTKRRDGETNVPR